MTLVIILFEGGISLRIQEIIGAIGCSLPLNPYFSDDFDPFCRNLLMVIGEDRMTSLIFEQKYLILDPLSVNLSDCFSFSSDPPFIQFMTEKEQDREGY